MGYDANCMRNLGPRAESGGPTSLYRCVVVVVGAPARRPCEDAVCCRTSHPAGEQPRGAARQQPGEGTRHADHRGGARHQRNRCSRSAAEWRHGWDGAAAVPQRRDAPQVGSASRALLRTPCGSQRRLRGAKVCAPLRTAAHTTPPRREWQLNCTTSGLHWPSPNGGPVAHRRGASNCASPAKHATQPASVNGAPTHARHVQRLRGGNPAPVALGVERCVAAFRCCARAAPARVEGPTPRRHPVIHA